jgi:hypothetical protein
MRENQCLEGSDNTFDGLNKAMATEPTDPQSTNVSGAPISPFLRGGI